MDRLGARWHGLGRLALLASILLSSATGAQADDAACANFKWPLAEERAWFAKRPAVETSSSASVPELPAGALAVPLVPSGTVKFALAPARKAKGDADNGAAVTIAALPRAGRYQVTLSADAWIDVIQDGAAAASVDHTGMRECPGVRKSVRFDLKPGPIVIQISGAAETRMLLAIRLAE